MDAFYQWIKTTWWKYETTSRHSHTCAYSFFDFFSSLLPGGLIGGLNSGIWLGVDAGRIDDEDPSGCVTLVDNCKGSEFTGFEV